MGRKVVTWQGTALSEARCHLQEGSPSGQLLRELQEIDSVPEGRQPGPARWPFVEDTGRPSAAAGSRVPSRTASSPSGPACTHRTSPFAVPAFSPALRKESIASFAIFEDLGIALITHVAPAERACVDPPP